MNQVTVCIPVGPRHLGFVERAVLSVKSQSVSCDLLISIDKEGRGPGYLRNRMAEQSSTPYLVFLDADDELMPTFIESTLLFAKSQEHASRYVYTDWYNDEGIIKQAPECAWVNGTWHGVTCLIPKYFHEAVGGFDETLRGLEDTDYFMRLVTTGRCGSRLPSPLFRYSSGGFRSKEARANGIEESIKRDISIKYGGRSIGCCGDKKDQIITPPAGKLEGDMLAITLWGGNHSEFGRATGRIYPRSGNGRLMWVNPADLRVSPQLWRMVEQPPDPEPPVPQVVTDPDITEILRRVNNAIPKAPIKSSSVDPLFVFPDKEYPSYVDIRSLVLMSGFKSTVMSNHTTIQTHDGPIILVSPEQIVNPVPNKRTIAWQLEYAGDYTHNYDGFKGEIWGSDKHWTDNNFARYVVLGSDPRLAEFDADGMGWGVAPDNWDITMLGYMTPRRQIIKERLSNLKWAPDYPGHGTDSRHTVLSNTKAMLHIHQTPYKFIAPQRFALAAAYKMQLISEAVYDQGVFAGVVPFIDYSNISSTIDLFAWPPANILYELLCVENTFRKCVEKALK